MLTTQQYLHEQLIIVAQYRSIDGVFVRVTKYRCTDMCSQRILKVDSCSLGSIQIFHWGTKTCFEREL